MSDIRDIMDFSPTRQIQVAACDKLRDTVHGISALHSSMFEGVRSPSPKNSYTELYQMSIQTMAKKKDEMSSKFFFKFKVRATTPKSSLPFSNQSHATATGFLHSYWISTSEVTPFSPSKATTQGTSQNKIEG
ncbi:hypothetical protein TNCV_306131 [Trichonephila clavipes]|nr:hypothetical protein TNCV_306131 [Trichonephila clavipes]